MPSIPLSKGKHTIVDAEDYEWLMQWKWMYSTTGYAIRHMTVNGKTKTIRMHRQILDVPIGLFADHINGNRTDNRRMNLRVCTHAENQHNYRSYKGSSIYKGVAWDTDREKWRALIKVNRKSFFLGRYATQEDAARAYNAAALKYFGEFAQLNDLDS